MIPAERTLFNQNFSSEKYLKLTEGLEKHFNTRIPFRVAETPVFLPAGLVGELQKAGNEIIDFLCRDDLRVITEAAIPASAYVGGSEGKPLFLSLDFAVTLVEGLLQPRLIELQGFPSLFAYQDVLAHFYQRTYSIPAGYTWLFGGLSRERYHEELCRVLLGGYEPREVILLDIDPPGQNTYVDFLATRDLCQIAIVGLEDLVLEDRKLYYLFNGERQVVKRIYNRVIWDELVRRTDLKFQFHLTEEAEVEWAGHPNWFFRISKFLLPLIKSRYVPETFFLSDLASYPDDLEQFVLKPLYSFSGSGVEFHVTTQKLDFVADKSNYILQKKVNYASVVQSLEGGVKTEVRLLYIWEPEQERPQLMTSLCRLSKGEMIGVKFNRDRTWVGASVAFFEQGLA